MKTHVCAGSCRGASRLKHYPRLLCSSCHPAIHSSFDLWEMDENEFKELKEKYLKHKPFTRAFDDYNRRQREAFDAIMEERSKMTP